MTMTERPSALAEAQRLVADLAETIDHIGRLRELGERGESAGDELADGLTERPLCADIEVRINVTLYTGGPAGGVEFEVGRPARGEGWEYVSARAWHQEWFELKEYVPLDDAIGEELFERWGVEYAS